MSTKTKTAEIICTRDQAMTYAYGVSTSVDKFTAYAKIGQYLKSEGVEIAEVGKTVSVKREIVEAFAADLKDKLIGFVPVNDPFATQKPWTDKKAGDKVTELLKALKMPLNGARGKAGNGREKFLYLIPTVGTETRPDGSAWFSCETNNGKTCLYYDKKKVLIATVNKD